MSHDHQGKGKGLCSGRWPAGARDVLNFPCVIKLRLHYAKEDKGRQGMLEASPMSISIMSVGAHWNDLG
eukprot:231301-Prorocentrum_lima.AAC.1